MKEEVKEGNNNAPGWGMLWRQGARRMILVGTTESSPVLERARSERGQERTREKVKRSEK